MPSDHSLPSLHHLLQNLKITGAGVMARSKIQAARPCALAFLCLSFLASSDAIIGDFNILTLVWSPAYCKNTWGGCCRPTTGTPELDFYVEAIRPYDSSTGKPLTKCNSDTTCKFYVNALKNIISDLYAHWPDVRCPSNNGKDNWESTWCTYGSCTNLTEANYFGRALNLSSEINPIYILQEYEIVPSDSKMYELQDIIDALVPSIGFSFYAECKQSSIIPIIPFFKESQLYKFHICISADAKRIITCPITVKSNCNSKVKFLPYTDNMLQDDMEHIKMPTERDNSM